MLYRRPGYRGSLHVAFCRSATLSYQSCAGALWRSWTFLVTRWIHEPGGAPRVEPLLVVMWSLKVAVHKSSRYTQKVSRTMLRLGHGLDRWLSPHQQGPYPREIAARTTSRERTCPHAAFSPEAMGVWLLPPGCSSQRPHEQERIIGRDRVGIRDSSARLPESIDPLLHKYVQKYAGWHPRQHSPHRSPRADTPLKV
jgi:hypothetical protein